ncbi:MAG: GDSL family lipase, partial [Nitrospirae bacterium]
MGDSLIEYYPWEDRFSDHEVYNLGRAGETVEGLLYRLSEIVNNLPSPDCLFIMTGINNVAMEDMEFFSSYEVLLNRLKDAYPSSRIYIHSLLPVRIDFIDNSLIRTVNERLRVLAESFHVQYIDLYSLFSDEKGEPVEG